MNITHIATQSTPSFWIEHFDAIITVAVTVVGFIITYFRTTKNFQEEIRKNKINLTTESIQSLPYDICQLMDNAINKTELSAQEYSSVLYKVLAYGSKEAVNIAVAMQELSYSLNSTPNVSTNQKSLLALYALLITQLKYDLTSEVISPESWLKLKMRDYPSIEEEIRSLINKHTYELELPSVFLLK